MKNPIVRPLRSLAIVAALFIMSSSLHAGASNKSGNPFGNGTFFSDSGNFSAIMRSSNGFLGVAQFTTQSTNNSASTATNDSGIATIYVGGLQFAGPVYGSVSGTSIAATYQTICPVVLSTGTTENDSVSGQFSGSLFNTLPTQSFTANGEAQANFAFVDPINTNNTLVQSVPFDTTVSGSRLTQ